MYATIFIIFAIIAVAILSVVNMGTISRTREASVGTLDIAGIVVGNDSSGTTTEPLTVPAGMKEIWKIRQGVGMDLAGLGSAILWMVLDGDGVVDAPQQIPIAGGGAENVDLGSNLNKSDTYEPLGIRVREGEDLSVKFLMTGEDIGDINGAVQLVFSETAHGPPLKFKGGENLLTTIDVDAQVEDIGTGNAIKLKVPGAKGTASKIMAYFTCMGSDVAALGSGNVVAKLTGDGVKRSQDIELGGAGGELVIGHGGVANAGFDGNADIDVEGGEFIRVDTRMQGEDHGSDATGIALGFVMSEKK